MHNRIADLNVPRQIYAQEKCDVISCSLLCRSCSRMMALADCMLFTSFALNCAPCQENLLQ